MIGRSLKAAILQSEARRQRAREWLFLLKAELDPSEARSQLSALRENLEKGGLTPVDIGTTDAELEKLAKCE